MYSVKHLLVQRLAKAALRTQTYLDDVAVEMLSSTHFLFIAIVAAYAASAYLDLSPQVRQIITRVAVASFLIQAAIWGDSGIRDWAAHYRMRKATEDAASTTSTAALGFIARAGLWIVIALMILDNLGFNITTLIASLGVGGIAVALAVQNILGDIFASLSIVFDKPFVVGDFIIVDNAMGTVEYVGLKTTRLRSLSGEQIVFSNADLLKCRIRNYKRMQSRRVVFNIGVTYGTSEEQLREIPKIVREQVGLHAQAVFDRAHFRDFGESSLNFEVVYNLSDPDYNLYMDIQQAINLGVFRRFAEEGIEFAYPTRTVILSNARSFAAADSEPASRPA
ncbi:MAG TPA: mechanosensitive ion channel family protein [Noviherbaspirillum sp.]